MQIIRFGIIGGGLMGREVASALARWLALVDCPARLELVAVCDINEDALDWFKRVDSVTLLTQNYAELLALESIDACYVAVPHNLHEQIYIEVLQSGKDLLSEKPFGIDLQAAQRIKKECDRTGRFVRCSSELPFLPGAQRVISAVEQNELGRIIDIRAGFLHASDLNPDKPINWKRQVKTCGPAGVMADLGMHVVHIPFRMGWYPGDVYAQLTNIIPRRPDGKGGTTDCDTWDNALLHTTVEIEGTKVPMTLETKRIAPGETNTWYIEVYGTESSIRYSTKEPKTLWKFRRDAEQWWQKTDLGFQTAFKTITGGIFEAGFPDCFQQMLAAFAAEKVNRLDGRFGCVTPEEAVASHVLFEAALRSHQNRTVESLG